MTQAQMAAARAKQNAPAVPTPLPSQTQTQVGDQALARELALRELKLPKEQRHLEWLGEKARTEYYRLLQSGGGSASAGGVNIHYNVINNFHGSSVDIEHRVAAQHRAHIDNMQRDVAEVLHRMARSSFVNRNAWT